MILGTKNQRDTEALSKISSFAYETEESLRNGMTNFLSPFPREEVNVDQDFNRYQKGMTDIRRKMGDIVRMYKSELKGIESIVKSAHSAKDKTEAKKLKTTIMQSMLAAYKEMSGLDTTLKKEREATNKLNRMVQGVSEGSIAATGNSLNADDVMSAFRQSYNPHMMQPQASTHVSQPINNFNLSVNTPQGTSTTSYTMNQEENTVTIPDSTKEPVKINDVPVIEAPQELPPIVRPEYNTTSNNSIIKNYYEVQINNI